MPLSDAARLDVFAEAIDQMVTIEIKNTGMPHGVLRPMYEAARELAGKRPISAVCAERLTAAVQPGDVVLVLTGAGYAPVLSNGESDGPPGAASLARCLYKGLGAVPLFVTEQCHAGPVAASSHAAGLVIKEMRHARLRLGAALATAPRTQAAMEAWTDELFAAARPKAVISAERLGAAPDGVIYGATAIPFSGCASAVDYQPVDLGPVMEEATRRGLLTIGIGDHGNELGFGSIREAVVAAMPRGDTLCAASRADLVFPAMMSNWACYGIEAALACLRRDPSLLHSPAQEERIVRACLQAGGVEAMFASADFAVDGLDGETSMACVQVLQTIVRKFLERETSGLAH